MKNKNIARLLIDNCSFGKQHFMRLVDLPFKGGSLDFSHLTELKNIYITEIYMRKQYQSSKIKNKKNYKENIFDGSSLKRLRSLLSYF